MGLAPSRPDSRGVSTVSRRRLRQDLDHLNSALLLLVTVAAIVTGVVAHVWDLDEFRYHVWAGYGLVAFSAVHVVLNWGRLTSYARFRLRSVRPRVAPAAPPAARRPTGTTAATGDAGVRGALVSRRGLLGLAAGGTVGLLGGRGLPGGPDVERGGDIALTYHQWSKPGVDDALGTLVSWGTTPPLYKRYPGRELVPLPEPVLDDGLSAEEAMTRRVSVRDHRGATMGLDQLSRLLALAGGLREGGRRRTTPSSGALYPIELYPVVHDVKGLEPGVYHYAVADHGLHRLRSGDLRTETVRHGLMQEFLGTANVVLYVTMLLPRMRPKYRERSYRYGLIEAGHVGQNVYLAATSMGLGPCAVGAYTDDAVDQLLGIDGTEELSVYMLSVGTI